MARSFAAATEVLQVPHAKINVGSPCMSIQYSNRYNLSKPSCKQILAVRMYYGETVRIDLNVCPDLPL